MRKRTRDSLDQSVLDYWRRGGLSATSARVYLGFVQRFRKYCAERNLNELDQACLTGVQRFVRYYRRSKGNKRTFFLYQRARCAIRAWACGLRSLGQPVPRWQEQRAKPALPPLLSEFATYRRAHNGIADFTLKNDLHALKGFLQHLRLRSRSPGQIELRDIDAFVQARATSVSTATVGSICTSLRAFLRFLQTTGRLKSNVVAGDVMGPRFRPSAKPPRTLPWSDVKRILHAVSKSDPTGKRDFAMLLLLATYGLGAAEIRGLRLEDLDWKAGVLKVRRAKTKALIELPLLPQVAKALIAYIRSERPQARGRPEVFLSRHMPYPPISSFGIRRRIETYAERADISVKVLGTHIFRHSHATRQIDAGANLKVVGDILGHRSSSTTSVYIRVALRRLRTVGLPVPR